MSDSANKRSVEQMCRDLLRVALEDGLVGDTDWFPVSDPEARTAGELVRMANCLSALLKRPQLEAEIERLQAELVWCHEGLTRAHEEINPGIPAPDWHTVYESLEAAQVESRTPGPELEVLVAERVMGQKRTGHCPLGHPACPGKYEPQVGQHPCLPAYSRHVSVAWEVLAVVRTWIFSRRQRFIRELQQAIARRLGMPAGQVPAEGELVLLMEPIDICLAVLAAVER